MSHRTETLRWSGLPHEFVLIEYPDGVHGMFMIIKPNGTQVISVDFPKDVTLDEIMEAWKAQELRWIDLFEPVKMAGFFAVIRAIVLKKYRVLWYVLHEHNTPQDACRVVPKPVPLTA